MTEVSLAVGFKDLSHFTASFRRQFNVSPSKYRTAELEGRSDPGAE